MIDIKNEFMNSNVKNDILSAFVISLILIPEAIVFSVIAGISPVVGLYTAFILGIITALINGKAGVISGLTGAVALVLLSLGTQIKNNLPLDMLEELTDNGEISIMILQYILLATIIAGMFQILFGMLKIAKYIRLVPNYVLFGLVNGLAIVTVVAQFYTFQSENYLYYVLVFAAVFMIYILPKYIKAVPSGFITILVLSTIAIYLDLDTKRIGDLATVSESFPSFSIPKIYINLDAILTVLPYALLLACVSNIESLMTVSLLDELDEKKGNVNQECIAMGAGNITCGFLGATAGSGMISQSVVNFTNGAHGRFSSLFVSVFIIVFILFLSPYIALIPVAVLVGILITVPLFLFQWQNNHQLKKLNNKEKLILVLVTAITCIAPLEIAFLISISLAFSLYIMNNFSLKSKVFIQNNEKTYEIHGPLYFNLVTTFLNFFDLKNDPKIIVIDFKHARIIDQAAIDAIEELVQLCKAENKILRIKYLSNDCRNALKEATYYCEYHEDDPTYKIVMD